MLDKKLLKQTIKHLDEEATVAFELSKRWVAEMERLQSGERYIPEPNDYWRATKITTAANALKHILKWAK